MTKEKLASGITAHTASGEIITGTMKPTSIPETITAGDTPVLANANWARATSSNSLSGTGISVTVTKAGTYRFKWGFGGGGEAGWSKYTVYSQLYRNGSNVWEPGVYGWDKIL